MRPKVNHLSRKNRSQIQLGKMVKIPLFQALSISLLGIVLLHSVALEQEPTEVGLAAIPDHSNEEIQVQAQVEKATRTSNGGWLMTLREGRATAVVYVEELDFVPRQGDSIQARGLVQQYQGEWELKCEKDNVQLTASTDSGQVSLFQLARAPEVYSGLTLIVTGYVEEKGNDLKGHFMELSEGQRGITLPVLIDNSHIGQLQGLAVGQLVFCKGELFYDESSFSYRFKVQADEHGLWKA